MKKLLILLFVWSCCLAHQSLAQTWIYNDTVMAKDDSTGEVIRGRVHMWVPPNTTDIRGIVLGTYVFVEYPFLTDPIMREVATREQLAIICFVPGIMSLYDTTKNHHIVMQQSLARLAQMSGFPEIEYAPVFAIGHSVGTIGAANFTMKNIERSFGAILYKGGIHSGFTEENKRLKNIPILTVKGEFEEVGGGSCPECAWMGVQRGLVKSRAAGHLSSGLVHPGGGHNSYTPAIFEYMAKFIEKAAHTKIPANSYAWRGPIKLNTIDESQGWLTDTTVRGRVLHQTAAYNAYTGDPKVAFWHFDKEMADLWNRFHKGHFNKKRQILKFDNISMVTGNGKDNIRNIKFAEGGETFTVTAKSTTGSKQPVKYINLKGPGEWMQDNEFLKRPELFTPDFARFYILAYQEETDSLSHGERCSLFSISPMTSGLDQQILFDSIPDKQYNSPKFKINAVSSGGQFLKVEKTIVSGPAILVDDSIRITGIPRGYAYVIVRAAQAGTLSFKTAQSVERVFKVTGPLATSIDSKQGIDQSFTVYPNPATERVNFWGKTDLPHGLTTISLYDLSGKKIKSENIFINSSTSELSFGVGELPAGIYLAEIQNKAGRTVVKVSKQ